MTGDKDENRKDKLIFLIFLLKDNCFTEFFVFWASLLAQIARHLPAMWETWVRSLGREDPLEKEMATHSNILAQRIPWMEELSGLQSMGRKESDTTEQLHFHFQSSIMNVLYLSLEVSFWVSQKDFPKAVVSKH